MLNVMLYFVFAVEILVYSIITMILRLRVFDSTDVKKASMFLNYPL